MKILAWNVRGAGAQTFSRLLCDLPSRHHVRLFALLEPRQEGRKARNIACKLGWRHLHVVEAQGFSGGLWVFWDDGFDFTVISTSTQLVHGVVNQGKQDEWFLTVVYGHPNLAVRRDLWNPLNDLSEQMNDRWVVMGDFNAVIQAEDRAQRRNQSTGNVDGTSRRWVVERGMIDIGFQGTHTSGMRVGTRPFRFFAPRVTHNEFSGFVRRKSAQHHDWNSSVETFTGELLKWNKEVFGNLKKRKDHLHRRLEGINSKISFRGTCDRLEELQTEIWNELERTLQQ
ncbi:hypothetical protein K1719_039684 [Acacia pycnantha]|nr:hypothetical protein K1719_039684 [Acacia pycnantha]